MCMQYIRCVYGVPAKRGARIRFQKKREGKILGADGAHLKVRFDDGRTGYLHPTWQVEYIR